MLKAVIALAALSLAACGPVDVPQEGAPGTSRQAVICEDGYYECHSGVLYEWCYDGQFSTYDCAGSGGICFIWGDGSGSCEYHPKEIIQ